MLRTRILSALVLIPIVLVSVWYGGWALAALVAVCATVAVYEFVALVRSEIHGPQGAARPSLAVAILATLAFVLDAAAPDLGILPVAVITLVTGALFVQLPRKNQAGTLNGWALTVAGALYIGVCLGYALRLRAEPQGLWWLILSVGSTWLGDTAAYLVGSHLGKTPLLPQISPSKTVEGAAAEVVFGTLVVMLLVVLFPVALEWWQSLLLGLSITIGAILGDLAESAIKRQVGVKDSSHLIPGHGGMFDRIDSLLVTMPLTYFAVVLFL